MPDQTKLPLVYVRGYAGWWAPTPPTTTWPTACPRVPSACAAGLVQIDNAQVPGAHRAFVHRSHSGRYGLVNSEEGYQNLRRFLFGDQRVQAELVGLRLARERGTRWQAEVRLSVRGLPSVMHERVAAHWCPVQLPEPHGDGTAAEPVPLTTTFLNSKAPRPPQTPTLRYVLHLRILSLRERDGILSFADHLEQTRTSSTSWSSTSAPRRRASACGPSGTPTSPAPSGSTGPPAHRVVTRTPAATSGWPTSRCRRPRRGSWGRRPESG
ncbi:hypothetical protein [Streptomyces sp. NPDC005476]|uniref:hypothetical protein n=1 Tax=Streptomyces sp. NPDC005476 TaxID=3156882 RepID=UPI003454F6BC